MKVLQPTLLRLAAWGEMRFALMRAKHPMMEKRFLFSREVRERNILLSSLPLPSPPLLPDPLLASLLLPRHLWQRISWG